MTQPPPTPSLSWINPRDAQAAIRERAIGELRIIRAGPARICTLQGTIAQVPLVQVEDRPATRDLIRRHRIDGDGSVSYNWHFLWAPGVPSYALVRIEFAAPVRATWSLVFDLRAQIELLQHIAFANLIALTVSDARVLDPEVLLLQEAAGELREYLPFFLLGERMHQRHQGGKRR